MTVYTDHTIGLPQIFEDAAKTTQMSPQKVNEVAVSQTANFNNVVGQPYLLQPTQQANINAAPGQPEPNQPNPNLLAQVENSALLKQVQPQVSGLGADIFGACCKGLEQAIQPVQEMVAPPQPANVPEPPVQKTYTAELEMNKFSPAGPGGMAA